MASWENPRVAIRALPVQPCVYAASWSAMASVSDPDPCGSVLIWLPWIRIRIGNTDPDPDPGQSKWCPKREQSLRFQV